MISHWLGWISCGCGVLLFGKYIGRVSKKTVLNRSLSKHHQQIAAVMGVSAILHAISVLFHRPLHMVDIISGALLAAVAIIVAFSGQFRKSHPKTWLKQHQCASIAMLVLLLFHVIIAL